MNRISMIVLFIFLILSSLSLASCKLEKYEDYCKGKCELGEMVDIPNVTVTNKPVTVSGAASLTASKDPKESLLQTLKEMNPSISTSDSSDEALLDALIDTIMKEPHLCSKIRKSLHTNCGFRGVLVSASDVYLNAVTLGGAVYCSGKLELRGGSKIVEDATYISDIDSMYKNSALFSAAKTLVDKNYFPVKLNKIPKRTQTFQYQEVSLKKSLRNADFSEVLNHIDDAEKTD